MVGDGGQPLAKDVVGAYAQSLPIRYVSHGPTRDFGNSQRTYALGIAHQPFVSFMDDDDVYTEDAFIKIRKVIAREGNARCLYIFKVVAPWREIVWTDDEVEQGNFCTIQMVLPNERPDNIQVWPRRQGGNIPYLEARMQKNPLRLCEPIIAICRPYEENLWFNREGK